MGVGVKHSDKKFTCCRAAAGRGEKVCGKSKKVVDNGLAFGYNIPCQQRRAAPDKPNNGDLHSGSAVDSDSTCGSSILSSPTRPQPIGLRYFRGIAQLVARLVRDEEAVGSNPAAPTKKNQYTFVYWFFFVSARDLQQRRPLPAAETGRSCWGRVLIFQSPVKGLRKNQQTQPVGRRRSDDVTGSTG